MRSADFGRLEVAQLADQDDVRVFAERGAQRFGEALRVAVHFALVHQTALVLVDVLDRILDGQDVLVALVVDLVEHRGQRRRLAAAGRPGDQHEPARPLGQRREHLRQAEILEALDLLGNQPVDGADRAALVEDVRAEPRDAADAEREVELERLLEALLLRVGHDAVGELLGLGRRQIRHLQAAAACRGRAPAAACWSPGGGPSPRMSTVILSNSGNVGGIWSLRCQA